MRILAVIFFIVGALLALNGLSVVTQATSVIHQVYTVLCVGFGAIIAVLACILYAVAPRESATVDNSETSEGNARLLQKIAFCALVGTLVGALGTTIWGLM